MGVFNSNNVKIGPGTLYAAPLGTTEPTAVTGAWPAGWTTLGYTDQGSAFAFGPQVAAVMVEEELWALKQAITGYSGKLSFVLAETTRQNLAVALNAGIGSSLISASQGSNGDGSLWQEPVTQGNDVRIMLGWDALPEAATSGLDPVGRLIVRQALQVGQVTRTARKGNNKSTYACEFAFEKPPSAQPFRFIFEPNLAA